MRRSTAQGLANRARIVLACAAGGNNTAVAARLGMDRKTVARWRTRYLRDRLDGLSDEPRPGVPRTITDAQVEEARASWCCSVGIETPSYQEALPSCADPIAMSRSGPLFDPTTP